MRIRELRENARESLKNNWIKFFFIFSIVSVASVIIQEVINILSNTTNNIEWGIASIIGIIVATVVSIYMGVVLSYGIIITTVKRGRGEDVNIGTFLRDSWENRKRAFEIVVGIILKLLPLIIGIIVLVIAIIGVGITNLDFNFDSTIEAIVFFASLVGIIVMAIALIVKSLSYAMIYYLAYDYPERKVKELINVSTKIMYGNKAKLFVLPYTFIGWAILSTIPSIIVINIINNIWPPIEIFEMTFYTYPYWAGYIIYAMELVTVFVSVYIAMTTYHLYMEQNPLEYFKEDYKKPETNAKKYNRIVGITIAVAIIVPIMIVLIRINNI